MTFPFFPSAAVTRCLLTRLTLYPVDVPCRSSISPPKDSNVSGTPPRGGTRQETRPYGVRTVGGNHRCGLETESSHPVGRDSVGVRVPGVQKSLIFGDKHPDTLHSNRPQPQSLSQIPILTSTSSSPVSRKDLSHPYSR